MAVKRQSVSWLKYLETSFDFLLNSKAIHFNELLPSMIPEVGGVYLITAKFDSKEEPYYIGRSQKLRRRIYGNHLMGTLANARLKKYLITSNECKDVNDAKEFIKKYCSVRWIAEADIRNRGALEAYFTALLFPKHGIYVEH